MHKHKQANSPSYSYPFYSLYLKFFLLRHRTVWLYIYYDSWADRTWETWIYYYGNTFTFLISFVLYALVTGNIVKQLKYWHLPIGRLMCFHLVLLCGKFSRVRNLMPTCITVLLLVCRKLFFVLFESLWLLNVGRPQAQIGCSRLSSGQDFWGIFHPIATLISSMRPPHLLFIYCYSHCLHIYCLLDRANSQFKMCITSIYTSWFVIWKPLLIWLL